MSTRIRVFLRQNVLGLVAIFIALSGTAYATHPGGTNTISSGDIINDEVRTQDIATGHVTSQDIGTGEVLSEDIGNGQVALNDLAANSVSSGKIVDGGILNADVQNNSLTGTKVQDDTLTGDDILNGSLGTADLAFDPATQPELNAHKTSADHDDRYWMRQGNAGTTAGKEFLGTTDDEPLELWVNNARALRLEPASDGTNQSPNVIGGIADNSVTAGVFGATIGGGGRLSPFDPASANLVTDDFGTVAGGAGNQAGDAGLSTNVELATVGGGGANTASSFEATVGGGFGNQASGSRAFIGGGQFNDATENEATVGGGDGNQATATWATVGGGDGNQVSGEAATVGGGAGNDATGIEATVGGGDNNIASGSQATVPGGDSNTAAGQYSLAAGHRAKNTNIDHDGVFLFADSTNLDFASTAANEFAVRASGGFRFRTSTNLSTGCNLPANTGAFSCTSDREAKSGFAAVEPRQVLAQLAGLPIRSWVYEDDPSGVRHIGPTSQAFMRAFGIGEDPRAIAAVDADGVALAAIQGLNGANAELRAELAGLKDEVATLSGGGQSTESPVPAALWGALIGAAFVLGALGAALALRRPRGARAPAGDALRGGAIG